MRCKVLKPKGSIVLRYVSSAKNPFDEQRGREFDQGFPQILLEYSACATSPGTVEVRYDVTRMTTLSKHLRTPVSESGLLKLLGQLKQLIDTCTSMKLPLKNVVLDVNQVYFDSWTDSLRFVYLPFEGIAPDREKAQAFFIGVARGVRPANAAAGEIASLYASSVESETAFNPLEISGCLARLLARDPQGHRAETSRSSSLDAGDGRNGKSPKHAGVRDARVIHDRPASAKASASATGDETTVLSDVGSATISVSPIDSGSEKKAAHDEPRGKHVQLDPGTSVLDALTWEAFSGNKPEDGEASPKEPAFFDEPARQGGSSGSALRSGGPSESETTVLKELAGDGTCKRFWLTRMRTNERVEVAGERFVVGKSKYSTYQVRGTNTVSRSHAILFCEQGKCWIEDNDSKNGTLVNGEPLASRARRILNDGDVVCMSDEEFVFVEECASV